MAEQEVAQVLGRCAAAHVEDQSGCVGPVDAVVVVDVAGSRTSACVHHGATLLASLRGGRVYPGSVEGAAVEAFTLARGREPFAFGHASGGR